MGIGADLKEVMQEVGTSCTIYKANDSSVSEYLEYETSFDSSTEFIRQFTLSASMQYDTQAVTGDNVKIGSSYYLIMNIIPERFENEVVENGAFLVKCNSYGKFARLSTPRSPTTYELTPTWVDVQPNVRALIYENIRDGSLVELTPGIQVPAGAHILLTRGYSTIQVGDRFFPEQSVNTEYYLVKSISSKKYSGLFYITLDVDTRE